MHRWIPKRCAQSSSARRIPSRSGAHRAPDVPVPRVAVAHADFREDLRHWANTNPRLFARILDLIDDTLRDPFRGIGKPEPLKHLGPDTWSRRITDEHRLVYLVAHDRVTFIQARLHYDRT